MSKELSNADKVILKEAICQRVYKMSYDQFVQQHKMSITISKSWRQGVQVVNIFNSDPLYRSYTSSSEVFLCENSVTTKVLKDEEVLLIKRRASYKTKQRRVIEEIRVRAFVAIRKFLHETFDIEPETFKNEDVVFKDYSIFSIGKAQFSFYGTLVDKDFTINKSPYSSSTYKASIESLKRVHFYFKDRQKGLYVLPLKEAAV